MEEKEESFKLFKHAQILKLNNRIIDYYTILDFDKTYSNFKEDKILITKVVQYLQAIIDSMEPTMQLLEKKNVEKNLSLKTDNKNAQNLLNFFKEIFKKIIQQLKDFYTTIKEIRDKMSSMETALSLYSDIDKIKNKKTTLEKNLITS